jgi:hypothetical protein
MSFLVFLAGVTLLVAFLASFLASAMEFPWSRSCVANA